MKNKSFFLACLFLIFLCGFIVFPLSCFASLTNATLNGEYIGISQARDGGGLRLLLTFDGNGNGTFRHLESDDGDLDSGSFIYNVSPDGTFVLISEPLVGNGIITADGEMGTISFIGDDNTNLTVFMKKSSGMSNSALNGEYIAVMHDTHENTCRALFTFDGNGNGTYKFLECNDGLGEDRSFKYNVSSDGTYTWIDSEAYVSHGIVTADGTMGTMSSIIENDYMNMIVFIKKSSGMSNSALNGEYIGINTADPEDRGGCRTLITFDGNGNATHQHLECMDGELDGGSHTYKVNCDGAFTFDTRDLGIVSADGEVVILCFIEADGSGDGSSFLVCVKKSSGTDVDSDIKANGSDGPITIMSTDNLSITIELSPGGYAGDNADWWLVAATPFGLFHYQPEKNSWAPDLTYSHQGPLFNLGEFEALNISGLPAGAYTIYFGVDMDMNGLLDMGKAHYDFVTVNIQ